jgi:hypothetical protein
VDEECVESLIRGEDEKGRPKFNTPTFLAWCAKHGFDKVALSGELLQYQLNQFRPEDEADILPMIRETAKGDRDRPAVQLVRLSVPTEETAEAFRSEMKSVPDEVTKWLERAETLGCEYIDFGIPPNPALHYDQRNSYAIKALSTIGTEAKNRGLVLLVRNGQGMSGNGGWLNQVVSKARADSEDTEIAVLLDPAKLRYFASRAIAQLRVPREASEDPSGDGESENQDDDRVPGDPDALQGQTDQEDNTTDEPPEDAPTTRRDDSQDEPMPETDPDEPSVSDAETEPGVAEDGPSSQQASKPLLRTLLITIRRPSLENDTEYPRLGAAAEEAAFHESTLREPWSKQPFTGEVAIRFVGSGSLKDGLTASRKMVQQMLKQPD